MSETDNPNDTQTINGVTVTDIEKAVDFAMDNRVIEEEYKSWKKNTPFLYDIVMNHVLPQVSLTCQWFPDVTSPEGKEYTVQRLLMGTQSMNDDPNYVTIHEVRLPDSGKVNTLGGGGTGGYGKNSGKIETIQQIIHKDHVHAAIYLPHNPDIILTKSPDKNVYVFDRTRHSSKPLPTDTFNPQLTLTGHTAGGFAIHASTLQKGYVASGSEDGMLNIYNLQIEDLDAATTTLEPIHSYSKHHEGSINSVKFSPHTEHLVASVGDDARIVFVDLRDKSLPIQIKDAHSSNPINDISFNVHDEHVFATCGNDTMSYIWDSRNTKTPLHKLAIHRKPVIHVNWSPFSSTILATSSLDRRIALWDTSLIGEEQSPEDAEDGPPELLFTHAGHTAEVNAFAWNPNDDWLIASTADDEVVQLWKIAAALIEEEEEEEDYEEEEDIEDIEDV